MTNSLRDIDYVALVWMKGGQTENKKLLSLWSIFHPLFY